ncbi:MAG: HTTM domain-containing protein, partial [Myxococcales bacterium]|nr:HTTM domain-containing protein [Myxococcales bacterium]
MNAWRAYWHDFEIERSRLAVLRFGMLGLLAWDLWTTFLGHATRYGAGDFNVTQARWLDPIAPLPTPAIMGVGWLLAGFLAARAALGIAQRASTVGAAVIYIAFYMWGQADSYQHHYFICLLLGVLAFLPSDAPTSEDGRMVRHWTMRAFYVQLTFLYLWTAVTKTDPVWLSGATLDQIVSKPAMRADLLAFGAKFGLSEQTIFPFMAVSVMLGQYFAATILQIRRFWWVGMLVIPWFHIFVEFIEFDIEYFSYYMIALLLVLLSPPIFWRWAEATTARLWAAWAPLRGRLVGPSAPALPTRVAFALITGAAAAALAAQIHIEGTAWLAGLVGVAAAAGVWAHPAGRSLT